MKNAPKSKNHQSWFFFEKNMGACMRGLRGLGYFKNNKRIGSFQERTFG
jgi:hypothetical protein